MPVILDLEQADWDMLLKNIPAIKEFRGENPLFKEQDIIQANGPTYERVPARVERLMQISVEPPVWKVWLIKV